MKQRQWYHRVKQYCMENRLFQRGDKVLVGLSGGADSVFLTLFLRELGAEWGLQLFLLHVNHGIRGAEADRDETFCREFAASLGIPLAVQTGDVPGMARLQRLSEEEAARIFRYDCLRAGLQEKGCDKIAVAHHRDDQAETVLFHMLRGSGLQGITGMRPVNGRLVRPLLLLSGEEIRKELVRLGQRWCEDSTNRQLTYQRNRIRRQVLPMLEEQVNTKATAHLAALADQLRAVQAFLEVELDRRLPEMVWMREVQGVKRWEVDAEAFVRLPEALQTAGLYRLLTEAAGVKRDIGSVHVEALYGLMKGRGGRRISLPYGIKAGKDYQMLWLQRKIDARNVPASGEREPDSLARGEESPSREAEDLIRREESPGREAEDLIRREESPSREAEDLIRGEESPSREAEDLIRREESSSREAEDLIRREESPGREAEDLIRREESPSREADCLVQRTDSLVWEPKRTAPMELLLPVNPLAFGSVPGRLFAEKGDTVFSQEETCNMDTSGEGICNTDISGKGICNTGISGEGICNTDTFGEGICNMGISGEGICNTGISGEGICNTDTSGEGICDPSSEAENIRIYLHREDFLSCFERGGRKIPKNNCTKWFDYDKIKNAFQFRHPRQGDYLWLTPDGSKKKSLRRLMIDLHIPRELRDGLWVLAEKDHIVWVPELGRSSARYYVTERTQEILCAELERVCDQHT